VVGILVSLMLSLAFTEVIGDSREIKVAIEREAVAILDTFEKLHWYGVERTREIQTILIDYTQAAIDDDWPALANDKLGQRVWALSRQLAKSVLEPTTSLQEQLWLRILDNVDAISEYRLNRLDNALAKPPIYVPVIVFGFLITMACFGAYRPHTSLVSLYAVFVGLVLHLVLPLSDPFQGGIGVDPTTFEHLVERLRSEIR
jgi:hypothetical protein